MPREETFDAQWLALREPVDHRSRAVGLLPGLEEAWRSHGWSRILDLGTGTGSNLRYLSPRLPGMQEWTLLDHDSNLLARVDVLESPARLRRVQGGLADEGIEAVHDTHLVTGAALLDLVSETWLRRLVNACRSVSCGAYFVLTYNGEIQWSPSDGPGIRDHDADDSWVRNAVNAHQRGDKGLGSALGPTAGAMAESLFRKAGYQTWLVSSPWRLGRDDAELARALVDGWERAAAECTASAPDDGSAKAQRIRAWAAGRRRTIASRAFVLTVGHVDLLALPA